jgi:hypothetical protein
MVSMVLSTLSCHFTLTDNLAQASASGRLAGRRKVAAAEEERRAHWCREKRQLLFGMPWPRAN